MFHQFVIHIGQTNGCHWHLIFLDGARGTVGHWVRVLFCSHTHHHVVRTCIKSLPNPLLRLATCAR